jgi:flagellar basal-body rod modification protein FlgD
MSFIQELTQSTQASSTDTNTGKKDDIMGKEDFLTLLVTQLKNQDPLNPDDPTEFTAQLAQFSSLEQLFNMNESMENLVTSNSNSDRLSTLQTIGKNVVYQESAFSFDGDPVEVGYQLDGKATEVHLAIQRNGSTIRVLNGSDLEKGNHFLTWDGLDENGLPADPGDYKVVVSATAGEDESIAASPLLRSEVTGVDLGGEFGGTLLTRTGEIGFNRILGVFEIEGETTEPSQEEEASTESGW